MYVGSLDSYEMYIGLLDLYEISIGSLDSDDISIGFRKRDHDVFNEGHAYEYKLGKKTKVIHKTVQCWIRDVEYDVTDDDGDVAIQHVI
jgi:hypothetical protein